MRVVLDPESLHGAFIREIEAISEQNLLECNQCGRCSAGCPLVEEMDLLPNQVIRFLQLGLETPLQARTPWVCAACLMCESRCPKDVDLPRVMEAVRQVALRRGESQVVAKDVEPALLARAPQMVVVGALRRGEK
ncbi:MAG: 4Fe-4S dicluster domain-containing protein [Chloroflexi bacterium]|nr:4Fe-4S dicluster domain-containing protein [Chloroflexota bacterium]